MVRSLLPTICVLPLVLALPSAGIASELAPEPVDEDLELADAHFGMHLGSNIATAGFGTGALAAGIHGFALAGSGQGPSAGRFPIDALILTSLGASAIISSATGAEANVRYWRNLRGNLEGASEAQRRLVREAEAERLRRLAINRAIGLAADGTFLGIGIALTVASPYPIGPALLVNGAFILGLDIFKLVVDDQVHRAWLKNADTADSGYFSQRRSPVRIRSVTALPVVTPDGRGGFATGSVFAISGTF